MKTTIFDFLNDITYNKKNILSDENKSELKPFFLNRWLSMRIDTIMYAQEMNQNHYLPKEMQYDYYLHSIKKQKRRFQYIKNKRQDEIDIIREYHGYKESLAKEILNIFTPEDFDYMRMKLNKGGQNVSKKTK